MTARDRYLGAIEDEMRHVVTAGADGPDLLYGMIRYHLGWVDADFAPAKVDGGKRVRPVLLLLANEAQGGDWEQAVPAAAAVELLHNFTLIHDDIEDRDDVRRGRPTLWTIWEVPQAINAGDALFTLAYRALLQLNDRDVTPDSQMEAVNLFTEATLRITEGQCLDIAFESEALVDEATYLRMIGGKTAALLGLACEMGAQLAGAPPARRAALCDFGEALGKAFQMQDDLLGLWGDPARTGKPVGSDLRKRKKTLPVLHGMAVNPEIRTLLLGPDFGEDNVALALEMLEEAGSRTYTEQKARAFHEQAMAAWQASQGSGEAHAALHDLAQSLLRRDK